MDRKVFITVLIAYTVVLNPAVSNARLLAEQAPVYSVAQESTDRLEEQYAMSSDGDDLLLLIPSIVTNSDNPGPLPVRCTNVITVDILIDTRWRNTPSSCDYLIKPSPTNQRLPIEVSARLTIDPGVNIRFAPNSSLYFRDGGRLIAVGISGSRIRFESENSGAIGHGLYFTTNSGLSAIRFADLVRLGKENDTTGHDAAIAGTRSSAGLSLRDTRISGSETSGAILDNLNIVAFSNNEFFGNALYGVEIEAAQMWKLDVSSDYLGNRSPNGRPYIRVIGVGSFNQVEASANWNALNAPYWVRIKIDVKSGDITVSPGARFIFEEGAGLDVENTASLSAIGTTGQPIVFTGEETIRGFWDGIYFDDSPSTQNRLENVEVSYGGGAFFDANVAVSNSNIVITNSLITDSDTWGICYDSNSTVSISGITYQNNRLGNLVVDC